MNIARSYIISYTDKRTHSLQNAHRHAISEERAIEGFKRLGLHSEKFPVTAKLVEPIMNRVPV